MRRESPDVNRHPMSVVFAKTFLFLLVEVGEQRLVVVVHLVLIVGAVGVDHRVVEHAEEPLGAGESANGREFPRRPPATATTSIATGWVKMCTIGRPSTPRLREARSRRCISQDDSILWKAGKFPSESIAIGIAIEFDTDSDSDSDRGKNPSDIENRIVPPGGHPLPHSFMASRDPRW